MANIQDLQGISEAREDLYNNTESGKIPDARARTMDQMLKNQTFLKGELPIKAFKMYSQIRTMPKPGDFGHPYIEQLLKGVAKFVGAEPQNVIEAPKG